MPDTARLGRAIAAGALALTAMVGVTGCQFQTLQQYTPADGVNVNVGDVMARNLVIVVTEPGQGVLLGTLVTHQTDTLESVKGFALTPDGDLGSALQVTSTGTITVEPTEPLLLLGEGIRVAASDLRPGLTARVELTFAKGGSVTTVVPVLDKQSPEYRNLDIPAAEASSNTAG